MLTLILLLAWFYSLSLSCTRMHSDRALDVATVIDPDNPLARLYLGVVLTNQGFYIAAREQLQIGLQSEELPQLFYELGYNFFGDGNVSEAILSFQEAVDRDPNFAPGYDALAHMYLQLGQDNQAEENALQSIALNPGRGPSTRPFRGSVCAPQ